MAISAEYRGVRELAGGNGIDHRYLGAGVARGALRQMDAVNHIGGVMAGGAISTGDFGMGGGGVAVTCAMADLAVDRYPRGSFASDNGIGYGCRVEFGAGISMTGVAAIVEGVNSWLVADVVTAGTVQNETGGDSVVVGYVGVVVDGVAGGALNIGAVAPRVDGVGNSSRWEIQSASAIAVASGACWM